MKKVLLFLLLLIVFTLTGCQSLIPCGSPLAGTQWKLVSWLEDSIDPSQFNITAYFDEEIIFGNSGVNSYSGFYKINFNHSFSLGDLQITAMGGSEEAMQAETIYCQLLQKASRYILQQNTLTLCNDLGQELLIFSRISENQGLANVTQIDILIAESHPVQVFVIAYGYLSNPCMEIGPIIQKKLGNSFYVTLKTYYTEEVCISLITPFTKTISLDVYGLPAGQYTVNVNGITGDFVLETDNFPIPLF